MAFVVTSPCFGCKHTECVTVCPTECFHEGEKMVYIDPECCTDCNACASVCPTEAIFYQDDVPPEWRDFTRLNAEMAAVCPPITVQKTPLTK